MPSLGGARQESASLGENAADVLGKTLLFKVVEVSMAQPGLYPILKPREMQHWLGRDVLVSGADPQETFELALQQANLPWIRPDMAFIPCPPFTVVGFNVTADVFLLPAGDRVLLEVQTSGYRKDDDGDDKDEVAEEKKKAEERAAAVAKALKAKVGTLTTLGTFVGPGDGIEAKSDPTGARTQVAVKRGKGVAVSTNLPTIDDPAKAEVVAWVKAAFPGVVTKDSQVEGIAEDQASGALLFEITESLGTLAGE
jgi:hypothetical protein